MKRITWAIGVVGALLSMPADAALFGWTVESFVDEWSGKQSDYAMSPSTTSANLDFPYRNVRSWIQLSCRGREPALALRFTTAPNLTDGRYDSNGRVSHWVNLRWANQKQGERHQTAWEVGDNNGKRSLWFLGSFAFTDDKWLVMDMQDRDWVKVQLNWYGSGRVVFRYDTRGFAEALNRLACIAPEPSRRRIKTRRERIAAGDLFAGCELVRGGCHSLSFGPWIRELNWSDSDGRAAYQARCDFEPNEFQPNEFQLFCPYTPDDIDTLERARRACPPKPQWVCCAARFVSMHRADCEPNCGVRQGYRTLLNDVAEACGGSDVQEGGGTLLSELWTDAGGRANDGN